MTQQDKLYEQYLQLRYELDQILPDATIVYGWNLIQIIQWIGWISE